ncbi:hypothetical protein Droror1_Dr00008507 [Drosera rotundifolia]
MAWRQEASSVSGGCLRLFNATGEACDVVAVCVGRMGGAPPKVVAKRLTTTRLGWGRGVIRLSRVVPARSRLDDLSMARRRCGNDAEGNWTRRLAATAWGGVRQSSGSRQRKMATEK